MTAEPLVVHLRSEPDADCVAEALAAHAPSVAETSDGWEVHVPVGPRIGELLSALQACLVENDISLVRLTLDGKTYAMEPVPADTEN